MNTRLQDDAGCPAHSRCHLTVNPRAKERAQAVDVVQVEERWGRTSRGAGGRER